MLIQDPIMLGKTIVIYINLDDMIMVIQSLR